MEDILQRVFGVLLTALVFFILPIYIAYEKIDDVSYALALKITTNFVEDVTNKGYLSRTMYNKFINDLNVTNNVYDIQLEHVAKKYYPVLAVYADDAYQNLIGTYDYNQYKDKYENKTMNEITFQDVATPIPRNRILVTYKVSEEKIYTNQILDVLDRDFENAADNDAVNRIYGNLDLNTYKKFIGAKDPTSIPTIPAIPTMYQLDTVEGKDRNIYTMNTGDEFNVIIKNKNTTVATVLFNTFTLGGVGANNTRVLVNYGGTIENMDYVNFVEETVTADNYINSSNGELVLLLDGENNTGGGHTQNSNYSWRNLVSSSNGLTKAASRNFNLIFIDKALDADKKDIVTNVDNLWTTNDFTIEMVFSYDTKDSNQIIFSRNGGGTGDNLTISNKNGKNTFSYGNGTSDTDICFSNSQVIENKIYSLSLTYKNGSIILYQNGNKISKTGNLNIIATGRETYICNSSFDGKIYSVRMYKRALDDAEIESNYNVDKSRFGI